jgi:hypothetical protein
MQDFVLSVQRDNQSGERNIDVNTAGCPAELAMSMQVCDVSTAGCPAELAMSMQVCDVSTAGCPAELTTPKRGGVPSTL